MTNFKPITLADFTEQGCRTQAQFDAVHKWFSEHAYEHIMGNPFTVDFPGETYDCTFTVMYQVPDQDKLDLIRVSPTGRITRYYHNGGRVK